MPLDGPGECRDRLFRGRPDYIQLLQVLLGVRKGTKERRHCVTDVIQRNIHTDVKFLSVRPGGIRMENNTDWIELGASEFTLMYLLSADEFKRVRLAESVHSRKQVYEYLHEEVCYTFMTSLRSYSRSKISTLIFRRALDLLVQSNRKECAPKRMTNKLKLEYIQAGLLIPPSRMTGSYLRDMFAVQAVEQHYSKFIREELKEYLVGVNTEAVRRLQQVINATGQDCLEKVQKCKKPYTLAQLREIMEEAQRIERVYGGKSAGSRECTGG